MSVNPTPATLAERLRAEIPCAMCEPGTCYHDQLIAEAADRLAVLEADNARLRADLHVYMIEPPPIHPDEAVRWIDEWTGRDDADIMLDHLRNVGYELTPRAAAGEQDTP